MQLKRKRSESELSSSSSPFGSPSRPEQLAMMDMDSMANVSPIRRTSRSSTPSHLHSRTLKRFRNSRPSDEEIHGKSSELSSQPYQAAFLIQNSYRTYLKHAIYRPETAHRPPAKLSVRQPSYTASTSACTDAVARSPGVTPQLLETSQRSICLKHLSSTSRRSPSI